MLKDQRTVDRVFGFLLSAACRNFNLCNAFVDLRSQENPDVSRYVGMIGTLKNAALFSLLITLLPNVPPGDEFLSRMVYTMTELLLATSHRNKAVLSYARIFRPLLDRFLHSGEPSVKLLRKLVEVGAENQDIRHLFYHVVQKDGGLHSDILEVIRSGMKAKWPPHFSLEGNAAVQFKDATFKGLPSAGFTFMVCSLCYQEKRIADIVSYNRFGYLSNASLGEHHNQYSEL